MKPGETKRTCGMPGCERPHASLNLCRRHYLAWCYAGRPDNPHVKRTRHPPGADDFWRRVDRADKGSCWNWQGRIGTGGYGVTTSLEVHGSGHAHRVAWIYTNGPIAEGLHLDHLCRNRQCVNPAHLEPVTPRENALRSEGITARLAVRDACDRGHPFAGSNLAIRPNGHRKCRQCHREYMRSWNAQQCRKRSAA